MPISSKKPLFFVAILNNSWKEDILGNANLSKGGN